MAAIYSAIYFLGAAAFKRMTRTAVVALVTVFLVAAFFLFKAERDEFEKLKSSSPKDYEELNEAELDLAHFLMAAMTLKMAQCGLVEEEKRSSIVYAEKHADKLFDDGGEAFFKQWKNATDKAALEQKRGMKWRGR